jgi:alkyl hydroperoxide reductase subunit AhpC
MAVRLGDIAPDFEADTTDGKVSFHDWKKDSWAVLFSHPKDFTPVCTTELGYTAKLKDEFDKRGVKVIGLSVDPVESHLRWEKDIEETQGQAVNFPTLIPGLNARISAASMPPSIPPGMTTSLKSRSIVRASPAVASASAAFEASITS